MACLIVVEGPAVGQHFALEQHPVVAIGRDEECTFQIVDPLISRQHLQIRVGGTGHLASDYRSANGVFINEKRVVGDVALADGDTIRIGGSTIVYSKMDYPTAEAAMKAVHQRGEWKRSTMIGR